MGGTGASIAVAVEAEAAVIAETSAASLIPETPRYALLVSAPVSLQRTNMPGADRRGAPNEEYQ